MDGKVSVEILIRPQPGTAEVSMFEGLADSISLDPINGIARILGRDYSSVLINSTFQDSFCNQTASEVANCIAERHGFIPGITTTSGMIGAYQCDGYNQMLLNAHSRITSEWDLLTHLARVEGYELFIDGITLVFSPLNSLQKNYLVIDSRNTQRIKFRKTCPLSYQTRLIVKSWNSWLRQVSLSTEEQISGQASDDGNDLSNDSGIEIAIVKPNLSSQGADQLAQRYMNAINKQDYIVEIAMPGDVTTKPHDILLVHTSGTSFDTSYTVKSVRREFSPASGFIQFIQGSAAGENSPP